MIVLPPHFQIIVDVIEYYAPARTFVMNGTELCASVFVVGYVPGMLRFYISNFCCTLKKNLMKLLPAKQLFGKTFLI